MNLRSGITAGLCLLVSCAMGIEYKECDKSNVDLELLILQDGTCRFDEFILKTHKFIPNFLSKLRHDEKYHSLSIAAALFGDKPSSDEIKDKCYEQILKRSVDYTKSSDEEFEHAMSAFSHFERKWSGTDFAEDSASAIAHSTFRKDCFSTKTKNDGVLRVVIVITDGDCKLNNPYGVDMNAMQIAIPCQISDYKNNHYPSDTDVYKALRFADVTPLIILGYHPQDAPGRTYFHDYRPQWKTHLQQWGSSTENLFWLDMTAHESTMEKLFTDALHDVTCRFVHNKTTTTTTTTSIPTTTTTTTTVTTTTTTPTTTAPTTTTTTTAAPTTTTTTTTAPTTTTTAPTTTTTPTISTPVSTSTSAASSNQKGKIIGAVAGASAGAMLLGSAAYFGLQTMTAAPQAANFNMPDIEQQHNGRVQQGQREAIAVTDETFFQ